MELRERVHGVAAKVEPPDCPDVALVRSSAPVMATCGRCPSAWRTEAPKHIQSARANDFSRRHDQCFGLGGGPLQISDRRRRALERLPFALPRRSEHRCSKVCPAIAVTDGQPEEQKQDAATRESPAETNVPNAVGHDNYR